MRYLCLIYYDEKNLNTLSQSARQALSEESYAYCDLLRQKGQFIAAEPLEPVHTATTVRIKAGKATTTDGPFAETKEQLGGFFMIDVADLNEAISVAAKIPGGAHRQRRSPADQRRRLRLAREVARAKSQFTSNRQKRGFADGRGCRGGRRAFEWKPSTAPNRGTCLRR